MYPGRAITIYGGGTQTRAFCYVDDLIEGMLKLMDAPDDLTTLAIPMSSPFSSSPRR